MDEEMPTINTYREGLRSIAERDRTFTGWVAAAVKVMLVTSNYTPSQAHTSRADAVSYEISGGDYTPGGQLIGSKSLSTVTNQLRLTGGNVQWSNLTVKPRYALIYDDTNVTVSEKTLFGYMDLGNVKSRGVRIKWPNTGVLNFKVEDAPGFP